jgi:Rha family phage regulatory protein
VGYLNRDRAGRYDEGRKAIADSRDVAATFGKEHKHVLRDIRQLIETAPELGRSNFGHTHFINEQNGQTYSSFEMDRDGFSLLAMGFTGEKALRWKLKYIQAFNGMEDELRSRRAKTKP